MPYSPWRTGPSSCSQSAQIMTSKDGITHWIDVPTAAAACHSTSSSSYSTEKQGWLKCRCDSLPTTSWRVSSGRNIAFYRPNYTISGSSTSPEGRQQGSFWSLAQNCMGQPAYSKQLCQHKRIKKYLLYCKLVFSMLRYSVLFLELYSLYFKYNLQMWS